MFSGMIFLRGSRSKLSMELKNVKLKIILFLRVFFKVFYLVNYV